MLVRAEDRYHYYLLMKELQMIEDAITTLREMGEPIEALQKRRNEVRRQMEEISAI